MDIINNSAFMGVIGVILGATISGIISSENNKRIFRYQKEQHRIEKMENTIIDFLILMQKVATLNLLKINKGNVEHLQDLKLEIFRMNERVKAEAQFYLDKSDYNLFFDICTMIEPKSDEEAERFNILRKEKMEQLISNIQKYTGK